MGKTSCKQGKKHIDRVLFYEALYFSTISLVLGLLGGILGGKLRFLLLLRLIHFQIPLVFMLTAKAYYKRVKQER